MTAAVAPAPAGARHARTLIRGPDGPVLTTGGVAAMLRVAPRTAAKWVDAGRLPGWRLPGSADRRVYARDLRDFLRANGNPVPAELDALCGGCRELVLYRVPGPPADRLAALAPPGGPVRRAATEFELGLVLGRPCVSGVVAVGSEATVGEAVALFAAVGPDWLKLHLYGPDQRPAPGADLAGPEHDPAPPGLIDALVPTPRG